MIFYDSPIKIEFTDEGLIVDGEKKQYSVRMLSELREVLYGHPYFKENKPLYLMYREIFKKNDIRFDITVIASRTLGQEYARTYGHYHPKAEDGLDYPEVYQILFGTAKFILQKKNTDESVDVLIVDAGENDIVLIPSGYGHVSINTSREEPLFLSNLVSGRFKSDYSDYKKNTGPALYYTINGPVQNTNYIIKNMKEIAAKDLSNKYGFTSSDLLKDFYNDPDKFEFLNKPSLLFR